MLQIGSAPEKEKDQVYVRFSARSFVYTLPKKIEEILNLTPADLRDRHLVRVDADNLDRLTIEVPGKSKVVLARKDQTWTIASKNNQPANLAEVTRLLDSLKNEQVTKFVEDVASGLDRSCGLDHPAAAAHLPVHSPRRTRPNSRTLASIPLCVTSVAWLAKLEGDDVFARVGEEPFIVAVRRALRSTTSWTDPAQWQELAVFKSQTGGSTGRLTVAVDGAGETALVRGAKNDWTRVQGNEPINQTNVQSLLNTLTKLHAVRWVGGAPPPQAFEKAQGHGQFHHFPDDKTAHKLICRRALGSRGCGTRGLRDARGSLSSTTRTSTRCACR